MQNWARAWKVMPSQVMFNTKAKQICIGVKLQLLALSPCQTVPSIQEYTTSRRNKTNDIISKQFQRQKDKQIGFLKQNLHLHKYMLY